MKEFCLKKKLRIGTFKRSINPKVDNFREFPSYLKNLQKDKNIAVDKKVENYSSNLENIFKKADNALDYSIRKIILEGPEVDLNLNFIFLNKLMTNHRLVKL